MDRRAFLAAWAAMPLYAASSLETFSAEEARIVEALCAQIVPADDAPGAKEAGVLYYIDRQLAGPLARFAPAYHKNLPEFATLPELVFTEQTAFLKERESDGFFALVTDHVMQGFYGSPVHGGNRDEASWKMLGIAAMMDGHTH